MASRDGYFAPESVIRRIGNTPLVPLLGGGPAVLLQVAHPLVAAGVVEHSELRRDLWGRLHRTIQALYLIVYGNKEEAEHAGQAVRAVHANIDGTTACVLGPYPAGTAYSAFDPDLMLWVHATLVDVALAVHNRFVARLDPEQESEFYDEMAVVADLFGTPASVIPPSLGEFRAYLSAQLDGPEICVTPYAREVAEIILKAPLPAPLRLMLPAYQLATAGLLPPRLRAEYGLGWSVAHEAALTIAAHSLRTCAAPLFRAAERITPTSPAHARRTAGD